MKRKFLTQSYLLILLFFIISCGVLNHRQIKHFIVKDAYYQSWILNENEKGTNIYLLLTDIEKGISFDSIIFRGLQMPVSIKTEGEITTLKSTINIDPAKLESEKKPTDRPDQLIYSLDGKIYTYKLETIRREKMKYY
jgi:hypothetical protein